MKIQKAITLAALFAALGVAAIAGACFSEKSGITGPLAGDCTFPLDSAVPGSFVIAIVDYAFVPAQVTVPAGTQVTWVNCGPADTHTATSDTGLWGSSFLSPGQVYTRRFDDAGVFDYHCTPHPFMEATVTVQ